MASDASDLGFELLPADDEGVPPAADLDAAAASAVAADAPVVSAPPEPFGRTPLFDFEEGRYVRAGGSPVWVTGLRALEQWCLMAIHTARYAHPVFSARFGMDRPESPIGVVDVQEEMSDWGERLRDALLVHDRIVSVENYSAFFDAPSQVVYFSFDVVTDEEERLAFTAVPLPNELLEAA